MGSPALEATLCDPKSSWSFKAGEGRREEKKKNHLKKQNRRRNSHTTTTPPPKGIKKILTSIPWHFHYQKSQNIRLKWATTVQPNTVPINEEGTRTVHLARTQTDTKSKKKSTERQPSASET